MTDITQKVSTRIFYISPNLIVMGDPGDGNKPKLLLRRPLRYPTEEDWGEIEDALRLCGMKIIDKGNFRSDGLWYFTLKEVSNGEGEETDTGKV